VLESWFFNGQLIMIGWRSLQNFSLPDLLDDDLQLVKFSH
jgi:hypothetical protein